MDLVGSFPISSVDKRWIIAAVDRNTKYAESEALPTARAFSITRFFVVQIVLHHEAPVGSLRIVDSLPCTTQLLQFYDIASSYDKNRQVDCIFLDFRKAFIVVRDHFLMQKLAKLNVRPTVYQWIANTSTESSRV